MIVRSPFTLSSTVVVSAAMAVAVGCSSSSPTPPSIDPKQETAALDAPNGGLTLSSKEAPAFGDPEVEALPSMVAPPAVPIVPKSVSSGESTVPGAVAYRLALLWGHLPLAHDATATDVAAGAADWNGAARIDAGTVDLLRTIGFGPNDAVTPTATAVTFQARTDTYVQGVLVRVLLPPGAALTVHFVTNLVQAEVDLRTLQERAGGIERAADATLGIGWIGFREDLCARGFILGRWVKDAPAIGRAFATISDADGVLRGYVRGLWGFAPTRAGEVWFDKTIDTAGNPKGLAFGWYGAGFDRGVWAATGEHDVSALDVGSTEGLYSDARDTGDGRGVWLGRWAGPCAP
jgi:hypothetical protein